MRTRLAPALLAYLALQGGCAPTITDPVAELQTRGTSSWRHEQAMRMLDEGGADPEAAQEAMHGVIWKAGYSDGVREEALGRLAESDLEGLKRTIRQQLPLLPDGPWADRLSTIIAERGWTDLTPALVNRWSFRLPRPDRDRAEYKALARLHGAEHVTDVVFQTMLDANKSWQQGLRTRCWDLLERLGQRQRLIELVQAADVAPDDAMFIDLRAAAGDLGIVPHNREEILWIRKLREPQRAEFWSQATAAIGGVSAERRSTLELRDLTVIVSAAQHEPALLDASPGDLYQRLDAMLRGQNHYGGQSISPSAQRLAEHRATLTWGDLAAMLLARRALEVPEVADHLFDYAARDRADTSTEYGGVIDLDAQGRFQVLEFAPRLRFHDERFQASPEMFDAGYTALVHFHFHVQKPRNEEYAGPGLGDMEYAQGTRANCLVLTSVGERRMNVDFYRHGGVVVDLGVIER